MKIRDAKIDDVFYTSDVNVCGYKNPTVAGLFDRLQVKKFYLIMEILYESDTSWLKLENNLWVCVNDAMIAQNTVSIFTSSKHIKETCEKFQKMIENREEELVRSLIREILEVLPK